MRIGIFGTRPDRRLPRRDPVPARRGRGPGGQRPGSGGRGRRRRAARRRPWPPRPRRVLASGVDGLVIAAATDAHPELILAAVKAGVPVFCEKPVARDHRGGHRGAARGRRHRRRGADRLQPPLRRRVRRRPRRRGQRRAGDLHTVRSTTLDPAPPPAAYIAASGGIFRDCAIHDFDIVRWVTGREVAEVYAVGGNRGAALHRRGGRRRHRLGRCSPSTTARSPSSPTPGTTPAATTSAWNCTA